MPDPTDDKIHKAVSIGPLTISELGDSRHIVISMSLDRVVLSREAWQELSSEVSYSFRWEREGAKTEPEIAQQIDPETATQLTISIP